MRAVVRAVKTALAGVSMIQELATWQPGAPMLSRPEARPTSDGMAVLPSMPIAPPRRDAGRAPLLAVVPPAVSAPAPQVGLRAIGQFHGYSCWPKGVMRCWSSTSTARMNG